MQEKLNKSTLGLALFLVLFATSWRVIAAVSLNTLPNFSPVMAMAFCCGMTLPGAAAFALPLGCLFASDLLLNAHYGQPLVSTGMIGLYACYLFATGLGRRLRGAGLLPLFGATVANSLLFYMVTNSLSWAHNAYYAQTFGGWVQALSVGRPGFPPTWVFFRNSLISDLLFTAVFLGALYGARKRSASPNLCRQESSL